MTRTLARWAVPLAGALVAIGCAADDQASDPAPEATQTTPATDPTAGSTPGSTELCVRFPLRDAAALFSVPDDPGLAGDTEAIDQLLEIGAKGLAESAPAAIRPAVETYAAALRDYQPGHDPMTDPATRAAVADIDAWLADNCPPPPATVAPGTVP